MIKPQNTQNRQKNIPDLGISASSAYSAVLEHFDQISEAPDAIPRLRRFILELAVRGKLVEQVPSDEPAAELLKRIEVEKARRVGAGEKTKVHRLSPIKNADIAIPLPDSWQWVRLGDIFDYDAGTKTEPKKLPKDAWLLELEDIEKDSGKIKKYFTVDDRSPKSTKSGFLPGDVLYGKLRPYLNKAAVADSPGFSTTEIVALRCYGESSPSYTCLALRRPDFVDYVTRLGQGTKMPRLRTEDAVSAPFPLPPLSEQHRIVAKLDELMKLCDGLEAAQQKREKRRDRLITASLAKLTDETENKKILKFSASSACSAVSRPEHIHQLRRTILNLAVRGKLVPQDPNDEPAAVFLKKIQLEKKRLFETRSIGCQKSSNGLNDNEMPYSISKGWEWVRVGEVGFTQTGNTPSKTHPEYFGNHIPFIKPADLNGNSINYIGEGISKEGIKFARLIPKNSVLIVCIGSTIGKVNIADRDVCCNQQINTITPYFKELVAFLAFAFKADFFQKLLRFNAGTGTLPIISKGKWEKLPIPLPPLDEQDRIVAKVNELMAFCDEIETRLNTSATTRRQLIEATLQEAFRFL